MEVSKDVANLNPGIVEVLKPQSASKYHNVKTEIEGLTFQSGKEAARCHELMMLERAHQIFALRFQVRFPLSRRTTYVADAVYLDSDLKVHIMDVKGFRTHEFLLKKRLFEDKYGIQIEEV